MTVLRGSDFELVLQEVAFDPQSTYELRLGCDSQAIELTLQGICKTRPTFSLELSCEDTDSGWRTATVVEIRSDESEQMVYQKKWFIQ